MKLIVNTEPDMAQLLRTTRTIAVVGLSPKPHRESFGVARYQIGRASCRERV